MSFELPLDLFDFEDSSPSMSLPSLAELKTPQPEVIIVPEVIAAPETPISRRNYRIGMDDILYPHGAKRKIAANIAAIKLLKELESSGKVPDENDCKTLIQYSGWGGIPQVFDPDNANFANEYKDLLPVLSSEEYISARASTLNSHYTPRFLIEFMWQIAAKAGISDGKFGEFGAGVGHFIGLMPENIKGEFTAVEIDSISGRILQQLYPESKVIINDLAKTYIKKESLDLVIGNVPFDQVGPHDSDYVGYNLHNYCIARALDALKPGGIAILLTSASTMDSKSINARSNFASRAALLTAIRLPNNAFAEVGTEVIADILVLQKGAVNQHNFQDLVPIESSDGTGLLRVNEYFAKYKEQILGEPSNTGKMYGKTGTATILPFENIALAELLQVPDFEVQTITPKEEDIFGMFGEIETEIELPYPMREYTIFKHNDRLWQCHNNLGIPFTDKNGREFSGNECRKIEHFIEFKELLNKLLALQLTPRADEEKLDRYRRMLNQHYDYHIKYFGNLNNKIVHRNIQEDPDYLKLAATENIRKVTETTLDGIKTNHTIYEKGDIYFKRTQHPWQEPESAENIVQAGMISYCYRHKVDVDYVAELMNIDREQAFAELIASGEFFENPVSKEIELKSEYLSGNVVRKLEIAKELAPQNVEALEEVQPPPLRIEDIDFQLGSFWIPAEVVQKWLEESFNTKCQVSYTQLEDKWYVTADWSVKYSMTEYRVEDWDIFKLVECALNLKEPIIHRREYDEYGEEKLVVNQEATLTARQYKNELQEKFRTFVMDSEKLSGQLEEIYNSIFNSHVTRQYELPEFEVYPGAVSIINGRKFILRTHQKRAVSRCIEGNALLAHCVGAGKTAIMVTVAMELKRLHLASKTLIVVQNATLRQFAEFAPKLYPNAQILIADKKDLVKEKRKRFMSRIAVGEWDMVIMAQSSFDMIKDDPDLVQEHYEAQLEELETLIAESDNRSTIKDAERQKKQLFKMLDKLNDKKAEEDIIYFSDLGIDSLIIDEAHAYKRNFFPTKMQRLKGLDRGASQRAFSLSLKIKHIMEKTGGRNVFFATGTPVTNTIAELWNMVRYISPATLEEFGISTFDRFASVFCGTETALELDAAGRFKMVQRFCKYTNVIELSKMFRTVADVVLSEHLTEVERPPIKGGKPEQIQIPRSEIISRFMDYLCDLYEWFENSSDKRELSHIPLLIYGMSRKVTIDPRLIDHRFPDDPESKLNICCQKILEKYKEYDSIKGTQIVFCDLYRNGELFNAWEELRRKLIINGIPANEVAVITDYNTDKQKSDLYERVNSGEVRVVIGSTMKLGTGVNIQERLAVEHDLDCPFRPSDVEQRSGRILRQGNALAEVEIIRYGIEQTLDAGMYAILERKQKFINDAMIGRCARTLEEINDDCALDFASFSAAISGNPKLRRKVVIETRLKELDALERQYRRNVRMRQDQEKSFATLIPAMQNEINILEKFIELNPSLELGTLPIRYGLQELSGTLSQKAEILNRHIKAAFVQAAANTSFLNPDGVCKMDLLHIGNLTLSMTAMLTKAFTDSNYGEIISKVMITLEDLKVPHLPVKVTFEANDGDNIFYKLRSLINDKTKELEKSRLELSGKIARLKKLKETPMEEFSAAAEKGALSTELDQIIYELNKTSEGQRRSYTSQDEPNLQDYFPSLGKVRTYGTMEILDGSNDTDDKITTLSA